MAWSAERTSVFFVGVRKTDSGPESWMTVRYLVRSLRVAANPNGMERRKQASVSCCRQQKNGQGPGKLDAGTIAGTRSESSSKPKWHERKIGIRFLCWRNRKNGQGPESWMTVR
jgi:hypothetical protein